MPNETVRKCQPRLKVACFIENIFWKPQDYVSEKQQYWSQIATPPGVSTIKSFFKSNDHAALTFCSAHKMKNKNGKAMSNNQTYVICDSELYIKIFFNGCY